MKGLDKFNLVIFSIVILVLAVCLCIVSFEWISIEVVNGWLETAFENQTAKYVILGVSILFILLAVKSIFFNSFGKAESGKDGILLENDDGKLLVSKDTIENLSTAVVKSFQSAENTITKVVVDQENNVRIFVTLFVYPDVVIKDLSSNLQTKIKETIKKSLDLDVKEVNIRVKNVAVKKEPVIKE